MQISRVLDFHKQQGHFLGTGLSWVRNFVCRRYREKQDWGRNKAGVDVVWKLISQRKEMPLGSRNLKEQGPKGWEEQLEGGGAELGGGGGCEGAPCWEPEPRRRRSFSRTRKGEQGEK